MESALSLSNGAIPERMDGRMARLKLALRVVGAGWALFFLLILANELMPSPLWERHSLVGSLVLWGHGGHEYLMMLCSVNIPLGIFMVLSAQDPRAHAMFIDFAVVANGVHLIGMLIMALVQPAQHMNLIGDVPAGLISTFVVGLLWWPVRNGRRDEPA